ncbi:unnamed protein product, partial [Ectocarpus sp. 4 AP-2014]
MESEERRAAVSDRPAVKQRDSIPRKNTSGPGNKISTDDALSHTGWSTSVAERLRAQTGGGGGGGGGRGGSNG